MNEKAARLVRQINVLSGIPLAARKRAAQKVASAWKRLDHRERGRRSRLWKEILRKAKVLR